MSVFSSTAERVDYLNNAIDVVAFAEERAKKNIAPLKEQIVKLNENKWKKAKIILGIVIAVYVWVVVDQMLKQYMDNTNLASKISDVSVIAVIILEIMANRKLKEKKEKKIAELNSKINAEQAWIDGFYNKNWSSVQHIPVAYHNTLALILMRNYIIDGRADSMQTAMNLCDEQLHRWKMEDMQYEVVLENREQSRLLRSIDINTAASATASTVNMFFYNE